MMYMVFTYGSLMCDDIMASIAGNCFRVSEAVLRDHQRKAVRNEHYPGMVPSPASSVTGVLYSHVSEQGLKALDAFEGEMYQRVEVDIELPDNKSTRAFTYIIRPAFQRVLSTQDWDFDEFLSNGKQAFLAEYGGFRR